MIVETRVFVASITISFFFICFFFLFEYFSNVEEEKTENQHRSICVECIQKIKWHELTKVFAIFGNFRSNSFNHNKFHLCFCVKLFLLVVVGSSQNILIRFVNSGSSKGKVFSAIEWKEKVKNKSEKFCISENVIAFTKYVNTLQPNLNISNQIWMVWHFRRNVCNSNVLLWSKMKNKKLIAGDQSYIIIIDYNSKV